MYQDIISAGNWWFPSLMLTSVTISKDFYDALGCLTAWILEILLIIADEEKDEGEEALGACL